MNKRKDNPVTTLLPDEDLKRLKAVAEKEQRSLAPMIRILIAEAITAREKHRP